MIKPTSLPIAEAVPGWQKEWKWDFRSAQVFDYFEVKLIDSHQLKLATLAWSRATNQNWTMKGNKETHTVRAMRTA